MSVYYFCSLYESLLRNGAYGVVDMNLTNTVHSVVVPRTIYAGLKSGGSVNDNR